MIQRSNRQELLRLLASWCNDTITSEEVDRLEELLLEDPEARQTYLEYASTEAEMHSIFASALDSSLEMGDEPTSILRDKKVQLAEKSTRSSSRWTSASRWMIAVSLIGVAAISSWLTHYLEPDNQAVRIATGSIEVPGDPATGKHDSAQHEPSSIARITATRNCRWGADSQEIGFNSNLQIGHKLELLAGVAEITFESGARVILEGPAKLNLETDYDAVLEQGRLAVSTPPGVFSERQRGMLIRMPRLGIALASDRNGDRGLHYGLSADGRGAEEVHVFRGDLETFLLSQESTAIRPVVLRPDEAARVKPASTTLAKFFADQDKFVRTVATGAGPHAGLYAYDGFDYPAGPLSGQNGGFGWAGAWADIEAATIPDQIASNVVQADSLGLENQQFRTLGGRAVQLAQKNRIRRALSTSLGGVFDAAGLVENQDAVRLVGANGKTIFLSFLQRVDRIDDGFYGVELHRGDGNPNRVLCIGNGAEGSGYGVTSNFNSYGRYNYAELGQENDDVNLIVIKIEYGQHHRDIVTVYRNPESLLDESKATIDAQLRGNFAFDRISYGNFDSLKLHEVDELRVGTTYRAVTGSRDGGAELLSPIIASLDYQETLRPLIQPKALDNSPREAALLLLGSWNP